MCLHVADVDHLTRQDFSEGSSDCAGDGTGGAAISTSKAAVNIEERPHEVVCLRETDLMRMLGTGRK